MRYLTIFLKTIVIAGLVTILFGCTEKADVPDEQAAVEEPEQVETEEPTIISVVETIDIETLERTVVYRGEQHLEAPNWSKDGQFLVLVGDGLHWKLPIEGGEPEVIDTDFADDCIHDHGISPDGALMAINCRTEEGGDHHIYTVPIEGGVPTLVTEIGRSYYHGWSPDGSTITYVGFRNDDYDIFTMPVKGGEERQVVNSPELDDGPDYSADGKYIYYNSLRDSLSQIWRVNVETLEEEQMTFDDHGDWFPHPSPDGKWVVFVSHMPGVYEHLANDDVMLRMIPAEGGEPKVLAELTGGRGTITSPSWAPDGKQFAFVSFEVITP